MTTFPASMAPLPTSILEQLRRAIELFKRADEAANAAIDTWEHVGAEPLAFGLISARRAYLSAVYWDAEREACLARLRALNASACHVITPEEKKP